MARKKVGLKIRPNSIEENESILRELRTQYKVNIDEECPFSVWFQFNNL